MTDEAESALPGRERESSDLQGAFRRAGSGRAGAVLVSGDAGVGKSRLVEELGRFARRHEATVLVGTAVDIADAPPFWPVLNAVRGAARTESDQPAQQLLRAWVERLPDDAGTGVAVRLLERLHQLILELAGLRPLLLVVEDLQWADRSTYDLVAYLVATLVEEPVLVVGTYRSDSPVRTPDLAAALAELRRHQKVLAVELPPLPRPVIAELVARWAPGRNDLEPLVWARSAGNAFIAEETVRAVLAGDARGLPTTLSEIVLSRVALLSSPAQQVVRAVAAGVGPLRHRLLADVLDLPSDALLASIREARTFGIVKVDPSGQAYQLRHGLMTDVVSRDLLPGERIDLHRRYALALTGSQESQHPGLAAQLAHHWYEAGDAEHALVAAVAAARASEGLHAYTEAHRHWLRAAELVPRVPPASAMVRRTDCVDRAARAAELSGDHDQAVGLFEQLLDATDAPRGLPAAILNARKGSSLAAAGRAGDAAQSYRIAAALLPDTGAEGERAQVLAGHSAALLQAMDFAGAREAANQALILARRAEARTVEARILAVLGFSLAYLEDGAAGAAAITEGLRVAEQTGEPEAIGQAYLRRAELFAGPLNQLVDGIAFARQGVERMRSLGLVRTAGVALLTYAANAEFRLGRWDAAHQAVAEAWDLAPTGAAALDVRLARSRIDVARGRFAAAADDLEAVELLARSAAGPRQRIPLLVLFSASELWRHLPAEALRHVEDGLDVAEAGADDIWSVAPLVWHGTRAWADLSGAGGPSVDHARTDRLRHHSAELARRGRTTVPAIRAVVEAFTTMCEAEMARAERASDPDAWSSVVDRWDRHQQPYPAAYARMRHAEALLGRHPRSKDAADTLRTAERATRALGAQPLLDDIIDLATRARIPLPTPARPADPPAPVPRTPLDELTPRELEVLRELGDGRTNREIAERLYISQKTVDVHVTRIFTKLGVHSRVQASASLDRSRRTSGPG